MKKKLPQISESEAIILEALWEDSPLTAERIIELVGERESWSISTVKTLLGRLAKKGAIDSVADGRRFLYRPLVSREDYLTDVSRTLLDRLFNGRVAPLVSHFAQHDKLSARDVAELKRILKELGHD
jgi:predicted transcriptional regulator